MNWLRWLLCCGIGVLLPQAWPAWTQMDVGLRVLDARMSLETSAEAAADWANAAFDDAHWPRLDQAVLAGWKGPYWLRLRLQLPPVEEPVQALWVSLRASSTLWWDGVLSGHNGRPGTHAAEEVPGQIDWVVPLDRDQAGPGTHVLAIRASSHAHATRFSFADFYVATGTLERLAHAPVRNWLGVAIAFGGMIAALAFFAALVRRSSGPRTAALLLLALGGVALALLVVESARTLFGYAYPWHVWRLRSIVWLTLLAALLLPAYLAHRFALRVPGWVWWTAAVLGVALALRPGSFDLAALSLHLGALLGALLLLWQVRRRPADTQSVARLAGVLLACLAALLTAPGAYLDLWFFVGTGALLVLLLVQHATLLAQARAQARQLGAERARLEAVLLKQSIQPHWLMNTLTALQELIEQQPAQASRMVEALGREFALLRQLSGQPLIPLDDELTLCRVHLEIMGMARLSEFTLVVEGDPAGILVPPGLLHTLVENGLTHAGLQGDAVYALAIRRCPHGVQLRMSTPLGAVDTGVVGGGTGTRYVRSSLESTYPQRHAFVAGAAGGRWCSDIRLWTAAPPCAC